MPHSPVVHRRVTRWANIAIFITVLLGGVVCATDSSSACPAWPVCYADQVGPDLRPFSLTVDALRDADGLPLTEARNPQMLVQIKLELSKFLNNRRYICYFCFNNEEK